MPQSENGEVVIRRNARSRGLVLVFLVLVALGGIGAHRWLADSDVREWFAELDQILEKISAEWPDENERSPVARESVQPETIPRNDMVKKVTPRVTAAPREVGMWESFRKKRWVYAETCG